MKSKPIIYFFFVTVCCYFCISFIYFFINREIGGGDEQLFLNDLHLIKNKGWIAAIQKNISLPYLLLAYPFSFLFEDYMALRITNLILLIVLFYYFYKQQPKFTSNFYLYLIFFISTVSYFYFGTNDTLFFVGLIVFINEVNNLQKYNYWNGTLAFIALLISFFTRELLLVYLPVLLLCFIIIYKRNGFDTLKPIYPIALFLFFIFLNLPSLQTKGKLSYDQKIPPASIQSNWAQRQYLAQLMVNKGELKNFNHPSWQATDAYLKKNGTESLPKGIVSGILFDPKLTLIEFFKDFYYSIFFGFRQLALILVFPLFVLFRHFYCYKKINFSYLLPFSTLLMLLIFSFIIISFVELRWLAPVFVLSIVYFSKLESENKIHPYWLLGNQLFFVVFSLYGIFNLTKKMGLLI